MTVNQNRNDLRFLNKVEKMGLWDQSEDKNKLKLQLLTLNGRFNIIINNSQFWKQLLRLSLISYMENAFQQHDSNTYDKIVKFPEFLLWYLKREIKLLTFHQFSCWRFVFSFWLIKEKVNQIFCLIISMRKCPSRVR